MFGKWRRTLVSRKTRQSKISDALPSQSESPSSILHSPPALEPLDPDDNRPSAGPPLSISIKTQQSRVSRVLGISKTLLRVMEVVLGAPAIGTFLESMESRETEQAVVLTREDLEGYCCYVMDSIKQSMEKNELKASPKMQNSFKALYSVLSEIRKEILSGESSAIFVDEMTRKITQAVDSFMLLNSISGVITMKDSRDSANNEALSKLIRELPHVEAAYDDSESKKKNGLCFIGTREALLQDIADWVSDLLIVRIYMLSGIAGSGKSTVAFTVAERAKRSGYLGASFFFSRDAAERSNAKKFFPTIAYQLCLYDRQFARAIDHALRAQRGTAAVAKDPQEQLEAFILEPLRDIVKSRSSSIVIVIDALDECDDQDALIVLSSLHHLVQELPSFKIFLTTRPQSHLPSNSPSSKVFHLQNIEDKVVNHDIKLYLRHSLSLEQVAVRMPNLEEMWNASDEEVESLAEAAGGLFIMAATVVRFVLDMMIHDPKSQMEVLKIGGRITLDGLEDFYATILRHAVLPGRTVAKHRFKLVVGTILAVQEPLPIKTLEQLTQPYPASAIKGVLANLQSVIMVNNDIPRVYHRSFYDFITNANHCAQDFLIETRSHHTRIAIRCFQIMNSGLKQNILNVGSPAYFLPNQDALAAEDTTEELLTEKISPELRYACVYWVNHLEAADPNDTNLRAAVKTFIDEHLMHWLEALSWTRKLGIAYNAVIAIQKLKLFSSDMEETISDALRFIPRFYHVIERSALHTYFSALPFMPTERSLYQKYEKEMIDNPFRLEGVPVQWDPMIAAVHQGHEEYHLVFSQDSSKLASFTFNREEMSLWDAENMAPIRTFKSEHIALANNFATAALLRGRTVTLWDVASSIPMAHPLEHPVEVLKLALSFDGSRVAVGLTDGTATLWDGKTGQRLASLENYTRSGYVLEFSPSGSRLAFGSNDGSIMLWDSTKGSLIAKLEHGSKNHPEFVFSRNGSRLAALAEEDGRHRLLLWDVQNGNLISSVTSVGKRLAISDDGSFIATGGASVQMWNENPLQLVDARDIKEVSSLAISHDILAIASCTTQTLVIYDIKSCALVSKLQPNGAEVLALSPDCTRLATGNDCSAALWDLPNVKTPLLSPTQRSTAVVSALVLSPDCLRLASGFGDGTVELWNTIQTSQPIFSHRSHSERIIALAFTLDGEQFASGSKDKMVRFWNGKGSAPVSALQHVFTDGLAALAFSSSDILACGTQDGISLWDHKSLNRLGTLECGAYSLSFSTDGSLLASARGIHLSAGAEVRVWNVKERTSVATFPLRSAAERLMFSPDGTILAIQSDYTDGSFKFFSTVNKGTITDMRHVDVSWIPHLGGIPISWRYDAVDRYRLIGRFSEQYERVPVLWIPEELAIRSFAAGRSIIALGFSRGVILLIRSRTGGYN